MSKTGPLYTLRAIRACERCRKQKTKCYPSTESLTNACAKCFTVGKRCSFEESSQQTDGSNKRPRLDSQVIPSTDVGLSDIKSDLESILKILREQSSSKLDDEVDHLLTQDTKLKEFNQNETCPLNTIDTLLSPPHSTSLSNILNPTKSTPITRTKPESIISLGLVTKAQAIEMIEWYNRGYDRWVMVGLSRTVTELIDGLEETCPLLLTALCLTGLRYNKTSVSEITKMLMVRQMKKEINDGILERPHSTEFLKSLVLIGVYGFSFTSDEFLIDPWFISSISVNYYVTLSLTYEFHSLDTSTLTKRFGINNETEDLAILRSWNHICLTHITNCVFSGRMCVLDEIRLDQSRKIINLSQSTNFDGRIVSEISLQLILYNYIQIGPSTNLDFTNFEIELKHWHSQWSYLFDQPFIQFVELAYHYCYLVGFYHSEMSILGKAVMDQLEFNSNPITNEDVLDKMIDHCIKVMDHINSPKLSDDYFAYLSDQIHVCTFYSSLIFLKLLEWKKLVNPNSQLSELLAHPTSITERFQKITIWESDLSRKFEMSLSDALNRTKLVLGY